MYATAVGLVLSGFRALDDRENRYMEKSSAFVPKKEKKDRSSDIFRKIIDKTKGLLIDDIDNREDY